MATLRVIIATWAAYGVPPARGYSTSAIWEEYPKLGSLTAQPPGVPAEVPWLSRPATIWSNAGKPRAHRQSGISALSSAVAHGWNPHRHISTPDQGGLAPPSNPTFSTLKPDCPNENSPLGMPPRPESCNGPCSIEGAYRRETRFPGSTSVAHEQTCSGFSRTVQEHLPVGSCGTLSSRYRVSQLWSDTVTSGYPTEQTVLMGSHPAAKVLQAAQSTNHNVSGTTEHVETQSTSWDISMTRRHSFTCTAGAAPSFMAEALRTTLV